MDNDVNGPDPGRILIGCDEGAGLSAAERIDLATEIANSRVSAIERAIKEWHSRYPDPANPRKENDSGI